MEMTNTEIYISITRGNETLTIDGTLCLFGELLTTLQDSARKLMQTQRVLITTTTLADPKEGTHVTN
jgi:hypothetical protein